MTIQLSSTVQPQKAPNEAYMSCQSTATPKTNQLQESALKKQSSNSYMPHKMHRHQWTIFKDVSHGLKAIQMASKRHSIKLSLVQKTIYIYIYVLHQLQQIIGLAQSHIERYNTGEKQVILIPEQTQDLDVKHFSQTNLAVTIQLSLLKDKLYKIYQFYVKRKWSGQYLKYRIFIIKYKQTAKNICDQICNSFQYLRSEIYINVNKNQNYWQNSYKYSLQYDYYFSYNIKQKVNTVL
ncbi:Hypothetical_protein [Hexamita inflata]|uniref:Hypothetical_protein n=1 Tax=Hexamita inflata TaxID=28002 RepID=A0AA86TS56_9EUKA|nr:Hypothetical protein HINF_LOCUS14010 [Hexamita inflata]